MILNGMPGVIRGAFVVALLAGGLHAAYYGLTSAWSDIIVMKARWNLTQWREGKVPLPQAVELGETRNALNRALAIAHENPMIHEDLGYLYGIRAIRAGGLPDLRNEMFSQALDYYRNAATLRPMSPQTWANIALANHYMGTTGPEFWDAFDRSLHYGRNEFSVQKMLAEVGFSRWRELNDVRRKMLLTMIADAPESSRKSLADIAARHGQSVPGR
ncbi:MAG: hypothetical protein NT159_25045 [Proteobacteria bacterium]|nr:hypothetical protein [Pseudomonadota bacterium]